MNLEQLFEEVRPNLDQLYKELNRKYFDNELPEVKTKWSNSTRTSGKVRMLYWRQQNRIEIKHLEISKHTEMTQDRLYGLMIHEMIHVYVAAVLGVAETTGGDKSHGLEFEFKRRELQRVTPFEIPLTEDATESIVSSHVKIKPVVAIIRGSNSIFAITEAAFEKNMEKITSMFRLGYPYEILLSDSNVLTKIPVVRTIGKRGISYYKFSDEDIQKVRDASKKTYVKISKEGQIV